ncbi:hypothetical protein EN805_33670, partial [bacterium M00.F.Ca.ET.162.01.1.1]
MDDVATAVPPGGDLESVRSVPGRSPPFPNMVWVPGGEFLMGSNSHYPEEAPAHRVMVAGFWM